MGWRKFGRFLGDAYDDVAMKTVHSYQSAVAYLGDDEGKSVVRDYLLQGVLSNEPNLGNHLTDSIIYGDALNLIALDHWANYSKHSSDNKTFNEYIGLEQPTSINSSLSINYSALEPALKSFLGTNEIRSISASFGIFEEERIILSSVLARNGKNLTTYNTYFVYELKTEEDGNGNPLPPTSYNILFLDPSENFELPFSEIPADSYQGESYYTIKYEFPTTHSTVSFTGSDIVRVLGTGVDFTGYTGELSVGPEELPYGSMIKGTAQLPIGSYFSFDGLLSPSITDPSGAIEYSFLNATTQTVSQDYEEWTKTYEASELNGKINIGSLQSSSQVTKNALVNVLVPKNVTDSFENTIPVDEHGIELPLSDLYYRSVNRNLTLSNTSEIVEVVTSIELIRDQNDEVISIQITTAHLPVISSEFTWNTQISVKAWDGVDILVCGETENLLSQEIKDCFVTNESVVVNSDMYPPLLIYKNGNYFPSGDYEKRMLVAGNKLFFGNYQSSKKSFKDSVNDPAKNESIKQGANSYWQYLMAVSINTKHSKQIGIIIDWLKENFYVEDVQTFTQRDAEVRAYSEEVKTWAKHNSVDIFGYEPNRIINYNSAITGSSKPKKPNYTVLADKQVLMRTSAAYQLDSTVMCKGVTVTTRQGTFKPNAIVGSHGRSVVTGLAFDVRDSERTYFRDATYRNRFNSVRRVGLIEVVNTSFKPVIFYIDVIEWYTQLTEDTYEVVTSYDLSNTNRIQGDNFSSSKAAECLNKINDPEFNHGFFIPLKPSLVRSMNGVDRNQAYKDCRLFLIGIHVKQRVYKDWGAALIEVGKFAIASFFGPVGIFIYARDVYYRSGKNVWMALLGATGLLALGSAVNVAFAAIEGVFAAIFGPNTGPAIAKGVILFVSIVLTILSFGGYAAAFAAGTITASMVAQLVINMVLPLIDYLAKEYYESKQDKLNHEFEVDRQRYLEFMEELDELGGLDASGALRMVTWLPALAEQPDVYFSRALIGPDEVIGISQSVVYASEEIALNLEK